MASHFNERLNWALASKRGMFDEFREKKNYSKLTIVGAFAEEQSPENVEIVTDLVNLLVIVSTQTPNPYNGLLLQGSNVGNISTQRVI